MVSYIRSDLDFILAQIKIAENHANGQPLFGPGGQIPAYNIAWGLRTVDGSYNHLLPGQEEWGAADNPFPELLPPQYRPADGTVFDPDGPGVGAPPMPTAANYNPSNNPNSLVFDSSLRTISNLLVDQTLGNPAAILTALQRAGSATQMTDLAAITTIYQAFKPAFDAEYQARVVMQNAKTAADALGDGNPNTPPSPAEQTALDALAAATTAHAATVTALEAARVVRDAALEPFGIAMDGDNVHLPAVAPDEGLSAPFNSWFTLFGQFFDHGLDLVNKGGSGTVFIPLQPDDPLYVEGSHTNFMVLTRATVGPGPDGIMGDNPATVGINEGADDTRPVNTTTAYVDQNQTYTSHPSHQVFLRQYVLNAAGDPVATGKLIEGANGGMATWGEVKFQARTVLGIQLTDNDVGSVPLMRTDAYGNFIPGANGFPQIITGIGLDGIPNTADDVVMEGNPLANGGLGISTATAIRTSHAFLADIAHEAVPVGKIADGDITIGLGNPGNGDTEYDNELLDAHFIAGDGRANENIGLTAVHHVFHAEHNRLVEHTKEVVLADANTMLAEGASQAEAVAFLNEWLVNDVAAVPASAAGLIWDGERLFQAAKFGTEMQYQHLVFEEFARKVQPNINVFLVPDGFDTTIDPSIVAEFAHVVYRFGHSMLTEQIDRLDTNYASNSISLIEGFLNPTAFNGLNGVIDDEVAAGSIIRGMTRQVGNEIDEFVTSALRNNLLGLPLDLATINLARGRDTGVPSLNQARAQFYEATNQDVLLKPYESWVDFAGHLKHEASIINFIAAYGTHSLITNETTIEGKRDAALTLIQGSAVGKFATLPGFVMPTDAIDFLNGQGAYGPNGALGGLNNVDLWIGGLAEEIMPFGGMLGSTFNFVFEVQMEKLQNGDRFYYLQRLDGLHLFGEMENNSFAGMIMRNTDATHLPSDVFSTPGLILEVNQARQFNDLDGNGTLESTDPVGSGILTQLVIRNDPSTVGPDTNYLRYTGSDHVVLGGTDGNDTLIGGIGDDTLFGDAGNDKLEGGFGNDIINGGDGDDIIKDSGGDDNIKAGAGNDVVHAGPGLDLVMGNDGQDFIFLGTDMGSEVFAGTGNDFIYGNKNAERILGNEGNDWIETGTFDGAPGDNFDEIFAHDSIDGHDVFLGDGGFDEFIGEGGDDIMVGSAGRGKMAGMSGFDWATYKDNTLGVNADLSIPIVFDEAPTVPQNAALDEFESMEGLSGSRFNDTLTGSEATAADRLPAAQGGTEGFAGSALDAEGIALIAGLQELLGQGVTSFSAGDIILGGDGSDVITGLAGDDIIDGDKWLDVQIGVFAVNDVNHTGTPIALHKSMTTLANAMFNGTINPGQLSIVRTIRDSTAQEALGQTTDSDGIADIDRAVFSGARAEYDITFNPNGTVTVAHTGGLATDGTDTIRNVEILDFTDQDISLLAPTLDLHGPTTSTSTVVVEQAYRDTFGAVAYNNNNGTSTWGGNWAEGNDNTNAANGDILITGGRLAFIEGTDGNETITRAVNLTGVTRATLSFDYQADDLDGGETMLVQVRNSANPNAAWTTIGTLGGDVSTSFSQQLAPALVGANTQVRFAAQGTYEAGENFFIDNVNIRTEVDTVTPVPGGPGNNYSTSYTENGTPIPIALGPVVTDDGTTIASARIVITNASAGDALSIAGTLPGGIASSVDNTVPGQLILNLTGNASPAAYQTAIAQIRYSSTSENPSTVARTINVTVNDGLLNSAVATTTVNVVATNDAPNAANDTVITNFAANTSFAIQRSALLANDSDAEGSPVTITAVGGASGLSAPVLGADAVTVSDTGGAGGSFTYTGSDGTLTDLATVTVSRVTGTVTGNDTAEIFVLADTADTVNANGGNDIIFAGGGVDTINAGAGNDRVNGGDGNDAISGVLGDDVILGGTGNDTITWNANANGATDGFDIVNGNEGALDTFRVTTRANEAETYRVYARDYWEDTLLLGGLQPDTEIVITRTTGGNTSIIAELDNIEEIRIGTQATDPVNGSAGPGDTVQIFGDFSTTSLALNTITIDGNAGDDTIDITSLSSAHRIVFRSNGGNDTIVGTLRPQDVIELPGDATPDDYDVTTEDGVTKMTSPTHTLSFKTNGGMPQFSNHEDDDEDEDDDDHHNGSGCDDDDDDDAPTNPAPTAGSPRTGTPQDDVLTGTGAADTLVGLGGDDVLTGLGGNDAISAGAGDDVADGGAGRDVIFGAAGNDQLFGGAGADMLYGEAGDDKLFGDGGDDLLSGGIGNDTVVGGAGNDVIVGEAGDGNDAYYGDGTDGGAGTDTLDLSAITANLTVDLGNGLLGRGSASSSQSGTDSLWNIENVATGSGNDTITASNAVNVMEGGTGNDTFRFLSKEGADGDTILGFEPGDRLDVSGIDANTAVAGNQAFTLVPGADFTATAQLVVTYETRADGDYTIVKGNVDAATDAEFRIELKGSHTLTSDNFNL